MLPSEKKKIKRSRLGCHRCKRLKVKCTEEKPACVNCVKARADCDYSIKLTWGGRPYRKGAKAGSPGKSEMDLGAENEKLFASVMTSDPSSMTSTIEFVPSAYSPRVQQMTPVDRVPSKPPSSHSPAPSIDYLLNPSVEEMNRKFSLNNPVVSVPQNMQHSASEPVFKPKWEEQSSGDSLDLAQSSSSMAIKPESHYNHEHPSSGLVQNEPKKQGNTPDFFATPSQPLSIDTPLSENPFSTQNIEFSDSFSADLARIERAFPSEQRSPFFENMLGFSPPQKDSMNEEQLEMEIASVLDQVPEKTDPLIQKRNELWQTALSQHSIPPSIVPLPELLLKVPYYRQLLHFWIDVAADNLVPAPYLYKDNPFKKILPQMAMHYPGLLTTLLAFSARARDDWEGACGTHSKIIDQLLGRSCNELLKQLQDDSESTSDGTFAISLLLSSYEVVHSNDFDKHRAHTTGASQIMMARTRKMNKLEDPRRTSTDDTSSQSSTSSLSRRNESDIAYFLSRWFVYVDVNGALSSTRDRHKYLRAYRNYEKYQPVQTVTHFETDDPEREIDYLLGFDPTLLPHFVNISLLIDEVEKYMAVPGSDASCIPQYIVTAALELKERSLKTYEAGEAKRSIIFDEMIEKNGRHAPGKSKDLMTKDNVLRNTNRIYYDTGLLNLYRRVLLLPRSSPIVQELIREMTEIFEFYIEPGSAAQLCTIFGLFCAGCDNLNDEKRQFYSERFSTFGHIENQNAVKSMKIMNRCWKTGEDWVTAANMLDIDLVLL